jgi:hypothetical protein
MTREGMMGAMKPHEETWEAREDSVYCPATRTTVAFGPMDEDTARFVAAAPDLARVLLAVEWHRVLIQGDEAWVCPSCGNERLDPGDEEKLPALVAAGMLGHRPDCALDGALRKAGVR